MNITIEKTNDEYTIFVEGRIDTLTAASFEDACLPLITDTTPDIIIDCSNVNYISSTGLRVFILADKKASLFNGAVTIKGLSDFLKNIFDISGLTSFFKFV